MLPPLPTPHQAMIRQMLKLTELFCARVQGRESRESLNELHRMIGDEDSWKLAHDFFDKIRRRSLDSDERQAKAQCFFEEACAKTLFNMTDTRIPFDEDAPYWVVPRALRFARQLGIEEREITDVVAA